MKKSIAAVLLAVLALGLCACQAAPEQDIVTSKNDGAFEAALESTQSPETTAAETAPVSCTDSFTNADGSITYTLSLTEPAVRTALPVVQARPLEITSETAERTARAIFGDANIYEYSAAHSKAELEEIILELRQQIGDWGALMKSCNGDEEFARMIQEETESRIAAAEALYATAPDALEPVLCDWQFHPASYYGDSLYGAGDNGYQRVMARATVDGVPFVFTVSNRDGDDFREHTISVSSDSDLVDWDELYADTGEILFSETMQSVAELVVINAVDGSVINTQLGY